MVMGQARSERIEASGNTRRTGRGAAAARPAATVNRTERDALREGPSARVSCAAAHKRMLSGRTHPEKQECFT